MSYEDKIREMVAAICEGYCEGYELVTILVRRSFFSGNSEVFIVGEKRVAEFLSDPSLHKITDRYYVGHCYDYTVKTILRRTKL